jgi:hypothetical protein
MPVLRVPVLSFLLLSMLAACEPDVRIDAQAAAPAEAEPAVPAVPRCPHCGWIESKREIVPSLADVHSLGIYEYRLRLTDGSSRVFRETLPTTWRLGERLTVIDGAPPPLD